jgi:hypothetical protein
MNRPTRAKFPADVQSEMLAALQEASACLLDVASGRGGWAWEEVLDRMNAAITKATNDHAVRDGAITPQTVLPGEQK